MKSDWAGPHVEGWACQAEAFGICPAKRMWYYFRSSQWFLALCLTLASTKGQILSWEMQIVLFTLG